MAQVFGDVGGARKYPFSPHSPPRTPGRLPCIAPQADKHPSSSTTLFIAPSPAITHLQVDGRSQEDVKVSTPFARLSDLIIKDDRIKFTTAAALAAHVEERIQQCRGSPAEFGEGCYMLVTGLPESQLVLIEKSFEEHAIRGTARFTYENVLESLIIRLMPGAAHEHTSRDFYVTLVTKIATLPGHSIRSIRSVGATHFVVPGKRSKQGDEGLRPATRTLITDWPSIMIEVGYSETLAYLRLDAAWWLENTQRQTRMAIIIKIAVNPCSMVLECWEMQESQNSPSTRGPDVQPACTQHFDIDNKGSVTPLDASLIIPYLTIFDTPHDDGADIILTSAELSEFATFLFGGLK